MEIYSIGFTQKSASEFFGTLKANGIEPGGSTELLELGGDAASQAVIDGTVDAAFLMGDSATPAVMKKLLWTPGVRLLDFSQATAFSRKFSYLEKLDPIYHELAFIDMIGVRHQFVGLAYHVEETMPSACDVDSQI